MKWKLPRKDIAKNSIAVLVILLVSILGVKLLTASNAATGAALSIVPTSTTVVPGSTVTVDIKADSGTDLVNSVQASLNYDATQLQYVSLSEGTAFPTVAANSTATAGVIRVGRASSTPVSGVNTVVKVTFKVLAASGVASLSFDKNFSFVVDSTTNADILSVTSGTALTVSGATTASASIALSPSTGNATVGSTISVTVRENSGTATVNSVQASIGYDPAKLQYVSMAEGGSFTNVAATDTATAGRVRVARAVQAGSLGVSGDNPIVTLSFKVLAAGSAALTVDKAQSFVVNSASGNDILATVAGSTYTLTAASTSSAVTMSLSPASGSYALNSTIAVAVRVNSATAPLTTVQATLNYPAAQLQYVSTTEGTDFTTAQRTNAATAGVVDIVRGIPGGNAGVTGTSTIVTVNFKVIATGTAAVTFGTTSSAFDTSGSGTNILDRTASTPASYTLTSATTSPTPSPTPTPTASPTPSTPVSSATLSLSPTSGSYATGSTVSVIVRATSATAKLTAIQSVLNYPAAQLQFVSVTEGTVFTTAQRTATATAGVVDLIRAIPGGNAGVVGTNPVVTVNFRVIGGSGAAAVSFGTTSAIYDDAGTGTNILNISQSTPASYTITTPPVSCAGNPTAPGTATRSASSTYTTLTMTWAASTAATGCTLAGYHVYRDGTLAGDVTTGTSFTDSGLTAGESHAYTVRAFDTAAHNSVASPSATLTSKVDDMAPTTPVGFTAAAPGASSVSLAWSPSTDFPNPGGVGIAGYKLYRNGSANASYTVPSGTSFTDTTVTANTTYTYVVTAYDKLGNESSPSNIVTAKTAAAPVSCTGNPTAPATLTAGASTLTSNSLSWTASTAATGCSMAGYRVYRDSALVGSPTGTSFTDSGLNPGTSYTYTVAAYDTAGHSSTISTGKVIATQADTSAPTAPTAVTATAVTSGKVDLAWAAATDNVAITGYKIYRGGTLVTTTTASARSYSDTTVSANTSYAYTVSAIDQAGNESTKTAATPSSVRTPAAADTTAPTTPSNLRAITITTSSVALAWNASTDATGVVGYHVYRAGSYIGDATSLGFADVSLAANSSYSYTVKAFDAAGNTSAASTALVVNTLAVAGCIVADLNCDKSVDIFDLSIMMTHWNEINVPVKFGDINQDGKVDIFDLSSLLSRLGDKG